MEKIFLIGDSIRMGAHGEKGYGDFLKEKLKGSIEVYQPDDNCRFAPYILRYLHEWVAQVPNPDEITHVFWNNGLWDTLIMTGEDDPLVPLAFYPDYMERVYKRIKQLFPNAEVVFINTTSIVEALEPRESRRSNEQIQEYNAAVQERLTKYRVPVLDFYTVSEKIPLEMRTDWVHYKTAGSEIFANIILDYLLGKGGPKYNDRI